MEARSLVAPTACGVPGKPAIPREGPAPDRARGRAHGITTLPEPAGQRPHLTEDVLTPPPVPSTASLPLAYQRNGSPLTGEALQAWLDAQRHTPYFEALAAYSREGVTPFHVPGHKHGRGMLAEFRELVGEQALRLEVTTCIGLDDLHHASGPLRDAQELAAQAYGADHTWFLINGSSSGVQAMIMATCAPGDTILIPRNAHKSTWGAAITTGALPVYVYPEYDYEHNIDHTPTVESYRRALDENPHARALLVVSPTYYGALADIRAIIKLAHERNVLALVDEAWGPHLPFWRGFDSSAMWCGADAAVNSTHKLVGAMSQGSMLHISTRRLDPYRVDAVARLFLSTSPSCLILSSIDAARKQMVLEGDALLEQTVQLAEGARQALRDIPGVGSFGRELIGRPGVSGFDPTRLSFQVRGLGITGYEFEALLRKHHHVQAEMSDLFNVLCLVTIGDREQDLARLVEGVRDLAERAARGDAEVHPFERTFGPSFELPDWPPIRMTPREAFFAPSRLVKVADALGEVASEMITPYPPGIPIICPGEEVTQQIIDYLSVEIDADFKVHGLIERDGDSWMRVLA